MVSDDAGEEHVGKPVVAQGGERVGVVDEVRDGTLYVAVDPDADRDTLDALDWDDAVNRDTHELDRRHVSTITDTAVRLRE